MYCYTFIIIFFRNTERTVASEKPESGAPVRDHYCYRGHTVERIHCNSMQYGNTYVWKVGGRYTTL